MFKKIINSKFWADFPTLMNVFSYKEAEKLIDDASTIVLVDCICKYSKKLIGEGCDAPVKDMCIILDD